MNSKLITFVSTMLFLCHFSVLAATKTIEDLVNQEQLSISLKIKQQEQQTVGQALIISIEVATDRWFAKGSRIQAFTLKKTVMQANNITTINGSKRILGQTWATQTHEITLYPTEAGKYQLAPIKLDVSINTENDGIVTGILTTTAASFVINLPEELKNIETFIVSPKVTLNVDGLFDIEKDYAVGEAITQTITITASDTPAMMIPPLNVQVSKQVKNQTDEQSAELNTGDNNPTPSGLSIYHKPAKIFDKANRGTLIGTRIESFTYIFEQPGSYTIKEHVIHWWNSQSRTLERLVIPASSWHVSDSALKASVNDFSFSGINFKQNSVFILLLILLLLIVARVAFQHRVQLFTLYNQITRRERRVIRKRFLSAIAKKDYLAASQYIFQYASLPNKGNYAADNLLAVKLNQLAFNIESEQTRLLNFTVHDAKALISQIDTIVLKQIKAANFPTDKAIKLNKY